jgi:hypothetical protein
MTTERFEPIKIRYDGLDAENHQIDLVTLGRSLEGAGQLIAVAAHYVLTGQYVKKAPALAVRVLAQEPEAKCYEIVAHITALAATLSTAMPPLPFWKELGTPAVEHVVNFILAKFSGRKTDMEKFMNLLETMLQENGQTTRAALDANVRVVELMANAQRPAARRFVAPIGESCAIAAIGSSERALPVDKAVKDAILAPAPSVISDATISLVLISELDMETGGCKVRFQQGEESDTRIPCEITDPIVKLAKNPYATAMKEVTWLNVRYKAQIKDGDIEKLYISEIAA